VAEQVEGWVLPYGARRWHFQAADRRTLCGRYGQFPDSDLRPDTTYPTSEDCAICRRRLDARKES
jgi:hypothetical protein